MARVQLKQKLSHCHIPSKTTRHRTYHKDCQDFKHKPRNENRYDNTGICSATANSNIVSQTHVVHAAQEL
jgi:hypothetical protein